MLANHDCAEVFLPKSWTGCVRSAVLHVISLAYYSRIAAWGRVFFAVEHCAKRDVPVDFVAWHYYLFLRDA